MTGRSNYFKDIFSTILDLPWIVVLFCFIVSFLIAWLIFAAFWYILIVTHDDSLDDRCVIGVDTFVGAVLFSIETQQTIGYGTRSINEKCSFAVLLVIIQSCFGLIFQAVWVGLIYTRLSRPRRRRETFLWSQHAVVSMRNRRLILQIRLADMRKRSTLAEAHVRMYFIKDCMTPEHECLPIHLTDMDVGFSTGKDRIFVHWPVIIEHEINEHSPLYEFTPQQISGSLFEILVILEGVIDSTGMVTQIKTSFLPNEILWGYRFEQMVYRDDHMGCIIDYAKLNHTFPDTCTPHQSAKSLFENDNRNQAVRV